MYRYINSLHVYTELCFNAQRESYRLPVYRTAASVTDVGKNLAQKMNECPENNAVHYNHKQEHNHTTVIMIMLSWHKFMAEVCVHETNSNSACIQPKKVTHLHVL